MRKREIDIKEETERENERTVGRRDRNINNESLDRKR